MATTDPIVEHEHNDNQWMTFSSADGLTLRQCAVGGEIDLDLLSGSINNLWQAKLVSDLDRCPHGRHEGDTCGGWTGPGVYDGGCYGGMSAGGPRRPTGAIVAFALDGRDNWQMPARADRGNGSAWKQFQ